MKLILDGLDLADAVATVSRATSARTINPILEGIKLTAKGGELTLSATDLEVYTKKTIRADIKQDGEVIVPGRLFADYVKKLEKSQITITSDGATVVINHGDNVCNFQCLMIEEYPDIVTLKAKPHFSIKSEALKDLIAKTTFSASADDARPVLKGVLCEIEGEKITAVALDGFRLSRVTKTIANHKEDLKVIIPARSLDEVRKLLADDNGEINIVIENKFFQINIGNTTFASRLIDGEYINYKQIIPASFMADVVTECAGFEEAVSRAGLLVRSDRINLVTLKVADKTILITSTNEIGKINERVPASLTGKDMTISFNAKYLFDVLRNTSTDFIKLSFSGELSPCVITSAKEGDFLFLVLPIRMN
ncbi:MAG: DNA polymerase III subunit beta [Firmicutes bacterium]|nr:DNA polymerase III subunit beta [Bacillota bacterium]